MGFNSIQKGVLPKASDIQQVINVLTGQADAGLLSLLAPVSAPSAAPVATLSAGSLTGSYQWGIYWITGIPDGAGNVNITGRTTPSPYSAVQTLTNQQGTINISGETIPTGVIGWGVVRNQAGGSIWYIVPGSEQFNLSGTMPLTYIDNIGDSNLVALAPATNTTGMFIQASSLVLTGLFGATATSRYAGATTSGPPTTGTFAIGDFVIDRSGTIWICIAAGSPGSWNGAGVPAGAVTNFAMSSPPAGWLKANGAAVSRTTYANLFAAIGTTFGAGDGSTTFNLPDLRGEFIRGYDDGRGVDSGRVFGSSQVDSFGSHYHEVQARFIATVMYGNYDQNAPVVGDYIGSGGTNGSYSPYTTTSGGGETRPKNIALLACIKY